MFKIQIFFLTLAKHMWPRVTFFALLAVATALAAVLLKRFIPEDFAYSIGTNAISGILDILASSMLTVTTFSLSVMVSAYSSATSNVTPRATPLLMQDPTTQNVLATFLGSFVFSLAGIIAISTEIYEGSGRLVLFAVTLGVIALILFTFIRWIDHLTKLGQVTETTKLVERTAQTALQKRAAAPFLGGQPRLAEPPGFEGAVEVRPDRYGYIQYIDVRALGALTDRTGCCIDVLKLPGEYVTPQTVIARVRGKADHAVLSAFLLEDTRTFEQDPRFGLCVLAEIALRALSSAINDPGTAIDVTGRLLRLLATYAPEAEPEITYHRVWIPPLTARDFFEDAFSAIVRDGASCYEVQARLQKAFAVLADMEMPGYRPEALRYSAFALAYSDRGLVLDEQKRRLHAMAPKPQKEGPARRHSADRA